MRKRTWAFLVLAAVGAALVAGQPASGQGGKPSFTLKYGVLSGLTEDPAVSGQAWNQAAKIGIDYTTTLKKVNLPTPWSLGPQDSQGTAGRRRGRSEASSTSPGPRHHRRSVERVPAVARRRHSEPR